MQTPTREFADTENFKEVFMVESYKDVVCGML